MAKPVSRGEVQTLARNGALLVEVLGAKEYARAHLPQEINIPLAELSRESAPKLIHDDRTIIVYCYDFQ
jgi:rhodanese-related sulfurtransferase